jgi:hypothetical protein
VTTEASGIQTEKREVMLPGPLPQPNALAGGVRINYLLEEEFFSNVTVFSIVHIQLRVEKYFY